MSFNPDPPPKYPGDETGQPPQVAFPHSAGYPPQTGSYPPPGQPGSYQSYPPQPGSYPPAGGQPPPPPGYVQGHSTVVIAQPAIGPLPGSTMRYGQSPALIVCQHCQATVTTSMDYQTGLLTWLLAGGICIVGCWLGCCFIPFCLDAAKDVEHKCPNCKNVVGTFRHIR